MATIQVFQHIDLSIDKTIDPFDMDTYCFNGIIPWTLFEKTLKSLSITEKHHQYTRITFGRQGS